MKNIILFYLVLVFINSLYAVSPTELLKIPAGARPMGMGGAFAGLADDPNALQWNPAGLAFFQDFQVSMLHLKYYFGSSYENIAYVHPISKGSLGLSVSMLHLFFDDAYRYKDGLQSGRLNVYDLLINGGYGHKINDQLSAGLGVKYIRSVLDEYNVNAFAFDIGVMYKDRVFHKEVDLSNLEEFGKDQSDLRVGLSIQNLGGKVKYNTASEEEGDNLPVIIKLGGAFLPYSFVTLLYEPSLVLENGLSFDETTLRQGVGAEFLPGYYVQPRIGYSWEKMDVFQRGDLTFGMGAQINFYSLFYRVDYAYRMSDISDVAGNTHWISLTIGGSSKLRKVMLYSQLPPLDNIKNYVDYLESKEKKKIVLEKDKTKKIYQVKINTIGAQDILKKKGYNDYLLLQLKELFKGDKQYNFTTKNLDVAFSVNMKLEGEVLMADARIRKPSNNQSLIKEEFEFFSELGREFHEEYKKVNVVIVDKDKPPVLVPVKKEKEKKNEDLEKLKKMAVDIKNWIDRKIDESLKGTIAVRANVSDVIVFVNDKYYDKIGFDKSIDIKLYPGKHKVRFVKEYYLQDTRDIVLDTGDKKNVSINLQKGKFYVDVKLKSFPSGTLVFLDGKRQGYTPLHLKKIQNGPHDLEFIDEDGKKITQKIELNKEGIYNFYNISEYKDNFDKFDKKFWRELYIDKFFKYDVDNKELLMSGKFEDNQWEENGVMTPLFYANNLTVSIDLAKKDQNGKFIFGFVDRNGQGFGVGYDGTYYDYVTWEKDSPAKFISVLDLKNKKQTRKITITFENGKITAMVDDYKLVSRKVDMENLLRIMMITDGDAVNKKTELVIDNFNLENK